jgi:hypothetical protein
MATYALYPEGTSFDNTDYIYAENNCSGEDDCGGMWFQKKVLIDYDVWYEVPAEVIKILEDQGYDMSYAKDE